MSLSKNLIALSLSSAALGLVLAPATQAAPATMASAESLVVLAAAKKAKGKKTCGTHMYWSAKAGRCMDARDKKK